MPSALMMMLYQTCFIRWLLEARFQNLPFDQWSYWLNVPCPSQFSLLLNCHHWLQPGAKYSSMICIRYFLSARWHLQLLPGFLVRFSSFEECERVNQLRIFGRGNMHLDRLSLLIHSFTSFRGRKSNWKLQLKLEAWRPVIFDFCCDLRRDFLHLKEVNEWII